MSVPASYSGNNVNFMKVLDTILFLGLQVKAEKILSGILDLINLWWIKFVQMRDATLVVTVISLLATDVLSIKSLQWMLVIILFGGLEESQTEEGPCWHNINNSIHSWEFAKVVCHHSHFVYKKKSKLSEVTQYVPTHPSGRNGTT